MCADATWRSGQRPRRGRARGAETRGQAARARPARPAGEHAAARPDRDRGRQARRAGLSAHRCSRSPAPSIPTRPASRRPSGAPSESRRLRRDHAPAPSEFVRPAAALCPVRPSAGRARGDRDRGSRRCLAARAPRDVLMMSMSRVRHGQLGLLMIWAGRWSVYPLLAGRKSGWTRTGLVDTFGRVNLRERWRIGSQPLEL